MILQRKLKRLFSKKNNPNVQSVIRIQTLSSLALGSWFVGVRNIAPWNSDWLLPTPNRVDHAVAQLNWEFFRNAPIFQWPPVLLPDLGVGWGTVYVPFSSGSLLGLPLRYFEFILPRSFQFLGIWIMLSFGLLGYWSVRLVSRLTDDRLELLAGSGLLIFSPTIFYRIGVLGHFELSAHWLLFAAIYLYLDKGLSAKRWSVLCVVTLIVNIYLFVMIFSIFLATVFRHFRASEQKRLVFADSSVVVASSFVAFASCGFLEYRSNSEGLGFFRSNGAAFIYPNFTLGNSMSGSYSRVLEWSGFFVNRPFVAYEREGFNFLGSGVLVGLLFACILLVFRIRKIGLTRITPVVPLVVVSAVLFANSLSQKIVIGRREVLEIPLPQSLIELRQIFRTGERFVWPLMYVLIFGLIAVVIKLIRKKRLPAIILLGLLTIQILDSSGGIAESRRILHLPSNVQLIDAAHWSDLLAERSHIALVPTFDYIADFRSPEIEAWLEDSKFFSLLKLAALSKSSTNFSVTGRPVTQIVDRENFALQKSLRAGNLDRATIYVFATQASWSGLRDKFSSSVNFEVRDGYFIAFSK